MKPVKVSSSLSETIHKKKCGAINAQRPEHNCDDLLDIEFMPMQCTKPSGMFENSLHMYSGNVMTKLILCPFQITSISVRFACTNVFISDIVMRDFVKTCFVCVAHES